jgi:Uma2 family endonuclease
MGDIGLFRNRQVERIDGEIVQKPPRKAPRVASVYLTADALRCAFDRGFFVRIRGPLNLGKRSEPEPDVSVVPGGPRDYTDHPTTALMVVEVSDTTLAYDRRKGGLYARAGIADYWIVNLASRQLEVRRNPFRDPTQRYGHGYRDATVVTEQGIRDAAGRPRGPHRGRGPAAVE